MEMEEDMTVRLQAIVNDKKLTRPEKIEALQGLYHHALEEKPGAEKSPVVDDHALSVSLRHIEKALAEFGAFPGAAETPTMDR